MDFFIAWVTPNRFFLEVQENIGFQNPSGTLFQLNPGHSETPLWKSTLN
jgi:hypothetical protein